jgi:hypothetical protein
MAYGLRTFDADGNILVDFSTQLTRLMFQTQAGAYESGSQHVHGWSDNGGHAWAFAIRTNTTNNWEATTIGAHVITFSGDYIYWSPNTTFPTKSYIYALMWGPQ